MAAIEPAETHSRRRLLGTELRRLREQAGLSGRELAARIKISQSKVSRIEAGMAMPTLPQVKRWAEITEAAPETTKSLVSLAEQAFTEIHTWRTSLQSRSHIQHDIQQREARARMVRTFQPSVVPGLLQTAEYARQVINLSPLANVRAEVAAAVAGRLDRQLALYEPDRKFEFLIVESALRWQPGPDPGRVLPAQLDRITSLSTLGNVRLGIIPYDRQALAFASHSFVIYEGRDQDDAFVTIEAIHAELALYEPDAVSIYQNTWALLKKMALFDDEARQFLSDLRTTGRVQGDPCRRS
jgi:transcriptional regulator with XRE-family HTH domain